VRPKAPGAVGQFSLTPRGNFSSVTLVFDLT
jgi:hypothetical protein